MGQGLYLIEIAAGIAGVIILGSMALALLRLVRGPSLADRAVALDLVALLAVGFAGVTALATGQSALLDVGISLALVAFLATLAFAWYLERRASSSEGG